MIKYPSRIAKCIDNKCGFCKGKPDSHVYKHFDRPGLYCGAYAIEITDFDRTDLYEAKHEANIS